MPTYEYECKTCSHGFEVFQAMSDAPLKDCPQCGKEIRRLIFGGAGVIFKGSGFYVTDKSKSGKAKPEDSSAKKPEGCGSSSGSCPAGGEASKCPVALKQSSQGGKAGESKSA